MKKEYLLDNSKYIFDYFESKKQISTGEQVQNVKILNSFFKIKSTNKESTNPDKYTQSKKMYQEYYKEAAFTFVSDTDVHLKQVVNTNKCILGLEKHGNNLLITSAIDNLLKGASGAAIQNMNLMYGFEETLGLNLKANFF